MSEPEIVTKKWHILYRFAAKPICKTKNRMVKIGYGMVENFSAWVSTRIVESDEKYYHFYNLRVHDKSFAK